MTAIAVLDEEEKYLAAILDDPSGIELAEFLFLDETPGKTDPCYRVRDYQWSLWTSEERYQIDWCVGEGQLVLTARGYVPIELVEPGDLVLTHKGRWKPVLARMDQGERDVVAVKGQGHPGLIVTPDHELYSSRVRRASAPKDGHKGKMLLPAEWRSPQDWVWNDGSGEMAANWASPSEVEPRPLPMREMVPAYASGQQNFVVDCFTEEWMWLFGLYLAEGSIFRDVKSPTCRISWSIHQREIEAVGSMLDKVGLNFSVWRSKSSLAATVSVTSRPVCDWLESQGGKMADGKSLPAWVLGAPEPMRRAVLDGMLYGDGSLRGTGEWSYTTISRSLAFGIRTLAATLGYSVSIWTRDAGEANFPGNRICRTRKSYVVGLKHISDMIQATTVFDGGHAWAAVGKVTPAGRCRVYDLEVADDHSFVVEGVVVHNCARDLGKALFSDTPLPTPGGWTAIGSLKIGDLVYDEKGDPTVVLGVYPQPPRRPSNRVDFDDGSWLIADDDHKWMTQNRRERSARSEAKVRTTKQIAASLRIGKEANHSIEAGAVLAGNYVEVEIDPWALGMWLGDGNSQSGHLTVGIEDQDEVRNLMSDIGIELVAWASTPITFLLQMHGVDKHSWKTQSFSARLRRMGLLNNKHIPTELLRGSVDQRLALLQGLMDSAGHITSGGRCEMTLSDERLIRDFYELLVSLGQKVFFEERRATLDGCDVGPCWRIGFQPYLLQPFRLPRKALRVKPAMENSRLSRRYIVDVRPIPSVPMTCIEVDSKSHLFLAGLGMVPTHNTEGILLRAFAFPFNFPGQEMLITAPQLNHLSPIVDKVEALFMRVRLGREMLPKGKGGGIKHQPQFQASFINGSKIMGRLPGPTGAGVKGQHSHRLELEEAQDYPHQGWMELVETMKDTPGAQWRAHGVSRGVHDMYYRLTMKEDPNLPFYVHRYMGMHRPGWSDRERSEKIAIYGGSRDNPNYKRNVYGDHGDITSSVFVLARLMACTRINESTWASEYNENVYTLIKLEDERVRNMGMPIDAHVKLPKSHLLASYRSYWAGMDIGFTKDPSELLVFGLIKQGEKDVMRLLTRIHMMRISAVDQAAVINAVADFYGERLKGLSLDKTGNGLPIWQETVRGGRLHRHALRIKGYGFSEKKAVAFDDRPLERRERPEDAVIEKNIIEFATDELRSLVDGQMIELPYDKEMLTEFQGQTIEYSNDPSDRGRKVARYGGGSFHTLDAAKLAVLGKSLDSIEAVLGKTKRNGPVLERFIA